MLRTLWPAFALEKAEDSDMRLDFEENLAKFRAVQRLRAERRAQAPQEPAAGN